MPKFWKTKDNKLIMSYRKDEGKNNPTMTWDVSGCDLEIMRFIAP